MFDLIIKNGTIIDGSGASGYRGDLGISGERIVAIGELDGTAERIIDAEGCVVAPGFIDIHAHTDALAFLNPSCESKVVQGVTTEVSGNCGSSSAPHGGFRGEDDEDSTMLAESGIKRNWQSFGEFFDCMDQLPLTINFVTLIGLGSIRAAAMGYEWRAPTADELQEMRRLVQQGMEDGAFGVSTGLIYPPGCYAEIDELVELSKVAAKYGGIYASHIRSESEGLIDAVNEAISIGRAAGIQVQLSHHKASGRSNWGKVRESLALIDSARSEGLNVWADQYPYLASSTGLGIMLPNWAHDGGTSALLNRLRDPGERAKIRAELVREADNGWIALSGGWEVTVISCVSHEKNRSFEGLNLAEIANITGKDPADVVLDLLLEEGGSVDIVRFVMNDSDVETVMRHPAVVIGSDATARCSVGRLGDGRPHPRSYGTFPRVLSKYSRDKGLFSLEEAVAKMTGRPASILSLTDRGLLIEGYYADVTVFDPARIEDTATYVNPRSHPKGMNYVLVNGKVVVDQGTLVHSNGSGAGKVLRHNANVETSN